MILTNSVFSEENFRKIVDNAPIGILIIDREMKWRFVNQRFCEITGYAREELASKTFLDITYKEDVENNMHLYNRLLKGEVNEYFYEKRYVRKNGQIIWVRLAVYIVENGLTYNKPGRHPRLFVDHVSIPGGNKISISDNGVGIPTKELDHIFNMFYKASISSHGSGMGLYIARKAVEKLKGEIMATSDEGEGSVFSIFLPMN